MNNAERILGEHVVRRARRSDIDGARSVMLDTFYRVFGHGYVPRWHADVIDIEGTYFDTHGHALFVAVHGQDVVGTAAVRADGPQSPPHAEWIARRYADASSAQLFRTYVRPEHRRHGLGRALVELAVDFVRDTPSYDTLYLHTNPKIEGAEPFWRSVATEVHDARIEGSESPSVHFEIPLVG